MQILGGWAKWQKARDVKDLQPNQVPVAPLSACFGSGWDAAPAKTKPRLGNRRLRKIPNNAI